MKRKFKKVIAGILTTAFVVCSYSPAFANTAEANVRDDFEQISIEYAEDGSLKGEIAKWGDTYYYRIFEDDRVVAIALNANGEGKIVVNTSEDNSFVECGTFELDTIASTTRQQTQSSITKGFESILTQVDNGTITLTRDDLTNDVAVTYAVPAEYDTLIRETIVETTGEMEECTDKFLASKSTSNIRASLYTTVEYRITNEMNFEFAKDTAMLVVYTLCSIPISVLDVIIEVVWRGGERFVANDAEASYYSATVSEVKVVKCDGHIDYEAHRSNYGSAYVANNGGRLSAVVQLEDRDEETVSNDIFYDNDAMLDEGIERHQNLCL